MSEDNNKPKLKLVSERAEHELIHKDMESAIRRLASQALLLSAGVGDPDYFMRALVEAYQCADAIEESGNYINLHAIRNALSPPETDADCVFAARQAIIEASVRYRGHDLAKSGQGRSRASTLLTDALREWREAADRRRKEYRR